MSHRFDDQATLSACGNTGPPPFRRTRSVTTMSPPSDCAIWPTRSRPARVRSWRGWRANRSAAPSTSAAGPGTRRRWFKTSRARDSIVGLDSSPRLLARARRQAPRRIVFAEHDITASPSLRPPADLIYGRFILTHLAAAEQALASWMGRRTCTAGSRWKRQPASPPTNRRWPATTSWSNACRPRTGSACTSAATSRAWERRRLDRGIGVAATGGVAGRRSRRACTR